MRWTAPARNGAKVSPFKLNERERRSWRITTVGFDLTKSVFNAEERVARRQVWRAQLVKCLAGLPAMPDRHGRCATANYEARELTALGHEGRLVPPACVKPYIKRHKNNATDAETICEPVTRPTIRFYGEVTRAAIGRYAARFPALLVKQRTMMSMRKFWVDW